MMSLYCRFQEVYSHLCLVVQTVTGFLIYDWIEQHKKQDIIKEVVGLLEQKVLVPHSGEANVQRVTLHGT